MSKFTGQSRYRVHTRLFRQPLLVLQLQVHGYVPAYPEGDNQIWWIDAKTEHIMKIGTTPNVIKDLQDRVVTLEKRQHPEIYNE